jgi:alkylation response protein AidB-like acyl-CoA dehydrogenase
MPARPLDDVLLEAQDLALAVVAPAAAGVDEGGLWPEAGLRALQKSGLGGLVVPEAHGGLGHGLYGLLRTAEVLGQHCASTAMCFGMHSVASAVISAKATPEQAQRYLEPIVRGRHLTTLALSEPGSGAHFYLPETRIERTSTGYRLVGVKSFVTNGGWADSYVMSGTSGAEGSPGVFSMMVVPSDAPQIEWMDVWRGTGMRGNSSRTARLAGVTVPHHALLGEEGEQAWYVFNVVAPFFLTAMAGTYLGVAQAALDETRAHLQQRRHSHSGQTLAQTPLVQHRLGSLWGALERARRLCYYAAEQGDAQGPDAMPAILSSKAEAADAAVHVANECLTLTGGIGYARGSSLDRHLRDARAAHVMAPTTDILRTWAGRWLLGEPLLSG